jgi:hypothetical protein
MRLRSSKQGTDQERNGTSADVVRVAVVKGPAFTLDREHVTKTRAHDGEALVEANSSPAPLVAIEAMADRHPRLRRVSPQRSSRAHRHQRQTNLPAHNGLAGLRRGTDTQRLPPCAVHRRPLRSEGCHARAPSFAARSQVNRSRW